LANYRVRAVFVLTGVVALLGLARWLDPVRLETPGHGYFFLQPCGFLRSTGYPCPTCYMTRSFVYLMHGHPVRAFLIQPFGALLCVFVMYLGVGAVRVLVTGRPWWPVWAAWPRRYLFLGIIAAFIGSWIFRLTYGTFITGEFPVR